mgnify:CR=1 FL=1
MGVFKMLDMLYGYQSMWFGSRKHTRAPMLFHQSHQGDIHGALGGALFLFINDSRTLEIQGSVKVAPDSRCPPICRET